MKKALLVVSMLVLSQSFVFAQEVAVKHSENSWALFLAASLSIALAALGTGKAMGQAIGSAVESISRNPGAADRIFTTMIIGLALIESIAIYALVVSLILLFVV